MLQNHVYSCNTWKYIVIRITGGPVLLLLILLRKTTWIDADGQTKLDESLLKEIHRLNLEKFRQDRKFPISGRENRNS